MAKGGKTTKNTNARAESAPKTGHSKKSKRAHTAIPLVRIMHIARGHGKFQWGETGKRALHMACNLLVQGIVDEAISRRDERKMIKITQNDLNDGHRIAVARFKGISDSTTFLGPLSN